MSTVIEIRRPESLADVVAANIRAEVARAGVRQRDFAHALGMSQAACSDRFRGVTPWTLNEIEAVSRLLGTTASDLLARPKGLEPPTF